MVHAQRIKVSRQHRSPREKLVQTVRQHFEAAIAQEKGRLSCFRFNIGKGASEHLQPVPKDAEPAITAADIVDIVPAVA